MFVKRKMVMIAALCASLFGAGIGATSAQVYDWRCQSCTWNFQSCLAQCDANGGDEACYSNCVTRYQLCKATFCP
jgi:hypothetical protein